jgi:Tfp pilus assembly protein PilP
MRPILITLLICSAAPAAAQVAVSTAAPAVPLTTEQAYRPSNGRDPLVPATVSGDTKGTAAPKAGQAPAVVSSTFNVYSLALTGIMEDSSGRQALLRDAAGNLYTLKAGHITDAKKKAIPGVSGVVKGKQVILMTEDKKVHHLNLRENE